MSGPDKKGRALSHPIDDQQLQEEIRALVEQAAGGAELGSGVGRIRVRVAGEAGGALHDPDEMLQR